MESAETVRAVMDAPSTHAEDKRPAVRALAFACAERDRHRVPTVAEARLLEAEVARLTQCLEDVLEAGRLVQLQCKFSRAEFGGDLVALGAEAQAVHATPAVDGGEDVRGKIAVVSRAEGGALELRRNCTDMALAAQEKGAVGVIAINSEDMGLSGAAAAPGAEGVTIPVVCVASSFALADAPALLAAVAARAPQLDAERRQTAQRRAEMIAAGKINLASPWRLRHRPGRPGCFIRWEPYVELAAPEEPEEGVWGVCAGDPSACSLAQAQIYCTADALDAKDAYEERLAAGAAGFTALQQTLLDVEDERLAATHDLQLEIAELRSQLESTPVVVAAPVTAPVADLHREEHVFHGAGCRGGCIGSDPSSQFYGKCTYGFDPSQPPPNHTWDFSVFPPVLRPR